MRTLKSSPSEEAYETGPAKKSRNHAISEISIEPAENGFVVTCRYKSNGPNVEPSVKKVATDLDSLYAILAKKLS